MRPTLLIVIAQLFGTSLWFSANGAADDLTRAWSLAPGDIGLLTNAVQLGFIIGTLTFSLSGLADRFEASKIFTVCAILGGLFNAAFALAAHGLLAGMPLRFAVGFCLAGVYPLGMKLIVSWVPDKAGAALSQLLGMLILGTSLPYGIRMAGSGWPWQAGILVSTLLAFAAAAMIWRLGDGPHLPRNGGKKSVRSPHILSCFSIPQFRAAAFGYFGHMWEVYAFWTIVPALVALSGIAAPATDAVYGYAFAIVAVGAVCSVAGGAWSKRVGSIRVAAVTLGISGLCCALYPFSAAWSMPAKLILMFAWGATVAADSPHFSALSARAAPPDNVGSALALQNAVGFAISMVSIQLATGMIAHAGSWISWLLLPGPLLGLIGFFPLLSKKIAAH